MVKGANKAMVDKKEIDIPDLYDGYRIAKLAVD